jgi:3-deoxy-D-manno-octulosonic-acid transferase
MRVIYTWLIRLAVPFAFAVVLWRGVRDRSYWQGLAERFGFVRPLPGPSIWLHAVSLGEMSAAAPLVRALHARYPSFPCC